jgi:predicted CoA-binding protein
MSVEERILRDYRRIAVIGLSDDPARPSHGVSVYMQEHGYTILPVNPNLASWRGLPVYRSLSQVPPPVEVVNVFRRPEHVAGIVEEAIAIGARAVWMQLGVIDAAAAQRAQEAGLLVVMDRCLLVEHRALIPS